MFGYTIVKKKYLEDLIAERNALQFELDFRTGKLESKLPPKPQANTNKSKEIHVEEIIDSSSDILEMKGVAKMISSSTPSKSSSPSVDFLERNNSPTSSSTWSFSDLFDSGGSGGSFLD